MLRLRDGLSNMEFNEKLQKLRTDENLTQEELAEKLYVSRTAISKWESGRGYPSIDSLKTIAKYFHVTIDELICSEEMVSLAEHEKSETNKKYMTLICGILDCLVVLLLFLPVFGDSSGENVSVVNVFALAGISGWLKVTFIAVIALTALNGLSTVVFSNFDQPVWNKHRLMTGIALSVIGTLLFVVSRQPYAGVFFVCILVIKGILLQKSK